MLVKKSSKTCL